MTYWYRRLWVMAACSLHWSLPYHPQKPLKESTLLHHICLVNEQAPVIHDEACIRVKRLIEPCLPILFRLVQMPQGMFWRQIGRSPLSLRLSLLQRVCPPLKGAQRIFQFRRIGMDLH